MRRRGCSSPGLARGGEDALLVEGLAQPRSAEIIAAALDEDGLRLLLEELLDYRDVLVDELLLKVYRRRGDDDALLVLDRPGEGGHEVGEGFADSGAGLGREDAPVVEGARHVARQANLAFPRLVAGDEVRELAVLLEHARYLVLVEMDVRLAPRGLGDDVHAVDRVVHDIRSDPRRAASAETPTSASLGLRVPEGWLWTMTSPRSR